MNKYASKSRMVSAVVIFLTAGAGWITFNSCGVDDGDFSDTKAIQKIIEDDQEEAFGPEIVNDSTASTDYSKASLDGYGLFKNNATLAGLKFGRKITNLPLKTNRDRQIDVTIIQPDSTAEARVTYTLQGQFVRDSNGVQTSKPLAHQLVRLITFEKRKNTATNETWRRTSTSAAFGYSGNIVNSGFVETSYLVLDSLLIVTPRDTIIITDPLEFAFYENNPIVVHQSEVITVAAKVRNTNPIQIIPDPPIGYVTLGRNKVATALRAKQLLINFGSGHFAANVPIGFAAQPHFSQLVIDFVTASTIFTRTRPYDSFLLLIPIRIE